MWIIIQSQFFFFIENDIFLAYHNIIWAMYHRSRRNAVADQIITVILTRGYNEQ